ncbi:MAG: prepilin-type N-terminal cleavage/methylation domain-containing protein [Spongiibacteraceae bacterium]
MKQLAMKQYGFSLIELVVVICIFAVTMSLILPYAEKNLKQAHETAVQLGARALHDGVERAKAIQMLNGLSGKTYNLQRFGDGTLDLSAGGFPAGTSRKPGDRLIEKHCAEIWGAVLDANPAANSTGNSTESENDSTRNYRVSLGNSGAKTGNSAICVYSYVHGGSMSISYDPATGKVWADTQFKGSAFTN